MDSFSELQAFSNADIQVLSMTDFEKEDIFDFDFGLDEAQSFPRITESNLEEAEERNEDPFSSRIHGALVNGSVSYHHNQIKHESTISQSHSTSSSKITTNKASSSTTKATIIPFYQTMTRDHRRDYARMFVNVHNMGDTNVLQKFFREFCTPGCRYVAEFPNAGRFNAPKVRRSKNREELITHVLHDSSLFPDLSFRLMGCKLIQRKGYVGSQLLFRLAMKGTVYRRADPCIDSLCATNGIAGRRAFYANQAAASSGTTGSGALRRKLCIHQRKLRQYEETLLQTTQSTSCLSLEESLDSCSNSSGSHSDTNSSNSNNDNSHHKTMEEVVVVDDEMEECLLCQAVALCGAMKPIDNNLLTSSNSPLIFDEPISVTVRNVVTFYLDEFHRIYCYEILAYE